MCEDLDGYGYLYSHYDQEYREYRYLMSLVDMMDNDMYNSSQYHPFA